MKRGCHEERGNDKQDDNDKEKRHKVIAEDVSKRNGNVDGDEDVEDNANDNDGSDEEGDNNFSGNITSNKNDDEDSSSKEETNDDNDEEEEDDEGQSNHIDLTSSDNEFVIGNPDDSIVDVEDEQDNNFNLRKYL